MAFDTTELLGAKQLTGAVVLARGWAWQHGVDRRVGLVGPAIGAAARKIAKDDTSQTPEFRRSAYLAVTDQEVALLTVQRGAPGSLGEVLARAPRADVSSAKLSPGVLRTNLTITFTSGERWEFEQSPLVRFVLARIVRTLGH